MRWPFGSHAERLLLNGMGLFNAHVDGCYARPLRENLRFFFRYVLPVQPLLGWAWLWGALGTLWVSLREAALPPERDSRQQDASVYRRRWGSST
jgi:hypothetical protein